MESKVLEGVKPFNDFWFKSCYYHQLIAGLHILGIDGRDIILSEFSYPGEDFSFKKYKLVNEEKLSKMMGYRTIHKNINEKELIKYINKGKPVILGVDCYYLEPRKDTFQKTHVSHFILAYGYNLKDRMVNIVDHDYINSFMFKEKTMSLDNLMETNKQYEKGICKAKTTSIILQTRKNVSLCDLLKFILRNKGILNESKENLSDDFVKMKAIFAEGENSVKNNYDVIIGFVQKMKSSRLYISKTRIVETVPDTKSILNELVSCYSFFTALLWKSQYLNDFKFCEERTDKIIKRINRTYELENDFYQKMLEVNL